MKEYRVKVKAHKLDKFLDDLNLLGYHFRNRGSVVEAMHRDMNSRGLDRVWVYVRIGYPSLLWGIYPCTCKNRKRKEILRMLRNTNKKED